HRGGVAQRRPGYPARQHFAGPGRGRHPADRESPGRRGECRGRGPVRIHHLIRGPVTAVGLPAGGWPISQYILKVHSRCDLACDHCYVYEHADQGWRRQPIRMDRSTVAAAAKRIAAHATAHALPQVTVVLHGGEPLLLGVDGLRAVLTELRSTIAPVTDLRLRMQSNGVRLNEAFCDVFVEYGVKVGISFDGDRA